MGAREVSEVILGQVWSPKFSLSKCPRGRRETRSAHSLGRRGEEHQLNEAWSSAGFSVATAAPLQTLSSVKPLRGIFKVITHCLHCLILRLGAQNSWKIHKHALWPAAFVWTTCFHMVLFKPLCAEHFWPKQFCSRIIIVVGVYWAVWRHRPPKHVITVTTRSAQHNPAHTSSELQISADAILKHEKQFSKSFMKHATNEPQYLSCVGCCL